MVERPLQARISIGFEPMPNSLPTAAGTASAAKAERRNDLYEAAPEAIHIIGARLSEIDLSLIKPHWRSEKRGRSGSSRHRPDLSGNQLAEPRDALVDHLVIGTGEADAEGICAAAVGKEGLARHESDLRRF